VDRRANCRDAENLSLFLTANLVARREVRRKVALCEEE
jgi:hypothetical protein